jgi:hypothetical protein
MSVEYKSGIVLYPEYGTPNPGAEEFELAPLVRGLGMHIDTPSVRRPAGPNLARQLGAVTNASMSAEGEVTLGTAHAVPYDPAIGVELTELFYPSGRHEKLYLTPPRTEATRAKHRELHGVLSELAYEYLSAQGLAAKGLVRTLADRRIDIIAPREVSDEGIALAVTMASAARPKGDGEPLHNAVGTVWIEDRKELGTYLEQLSTRRHSHLLRDHPLRVIHGDDITVQDHRILTTRATGLTQIHERLTMVTGSPHSEVLKKSGGFSYGATWRTITDEYAGRYDLPVSAETAAEIDRLQWAIRMEDEAAAAERATKQPEEWTYEDHYHPDAAGDAILDGEVHQIVFHIDPLDDPAWRDRLS